MNNNEIKLTDGQEQTLDAIIARLNQQVVQQKQQATQPFIKPPLAPEPPKFSAPVVPESAPQYTMLLKPELTGEDAGAILKEIQDGVNKMLEGKKEQLQELQLQQMAGQRAENVPLPGNVKKAFENKDVTIETSVGPVLIRKKMLIDTEIFELTNSPIYQAQLNNTDSVKFEGSYLCDLIYQFTHTAREAYALASTDIKKYHKEALELGFIYDALDTEKLCSAILGEIIFANESKIGAKSTDDVEDKKK